MCIAAGVFEYEDEYQWKIENQQFPEIWNQYYL